MNACLFDNSAGKLGAWPPDFPISLDIWMIFWQKKNGEQHFFSAKALHWTNRHVIAPVREFVPKVHSVLSHVAQGTNCAFLCNRSDYRKFIK